MGPIWWQIRLKKFKLKKKKNEQMLQSTTATNVNNPSIQWALKKNSLSP
jgi:hypothetical protein